VTKWFLEVHPHYSKAIYSDDIHLLIWAYENNKKIIPKLSKISEKGDIQTFKWVSENMSVKGNESNLNIINFAAKSGHLEFVKMLHELGWPFDCYTWSYATCNGNLELLKWLHSNNCPIPPYAYGEAPRDGEKSLILLLGIFL
jgi:hypothetical protein